MKKDNKKNDAAAILEIVGLAYNGYGVGKYQDKCSDKITFVDHACPGDIAEVIIYEEHKRYGFGKINKMVYPSSSRVEPVCRYFTICGGCNYLNISYETEVYWKKKIFADNFAKAGLYINNNKPYETIDVIKSEDVLHYRQKISLKVYSDEAVGLFKRNSHYVVDVDYCYLASGRINTMIETIRNFFLKNNKSLLKKIKLIILTDVEAQSAILQLKDEFSGKEKKILSNLDINKIYIEFNEKKEKIEKKRNIQEIRQIREIREDIKDYFTLSGIKFAYESFSFIQVNKKQNENLINLIINYLADYQTKRCGILNKDDFLFDKALDLFCGYGNLTFFALPFVSQMTGVESNIYSVELANKNIILNNDLIERIERCIPDRYKKHSYKKQPFISFINEDVEKFLINAAKNNSSYDLIMIDPPRAGIKGLVGYIADLSPELVIYLSCDHMTLLRDLKEFIQEGYFIDDIKLIDMFPRTYHTESLVFLKNEKIINST
ncbi:MAG: 23S rRNA (uracil(1939)-C(5))-methyltransferase RlmD [Candidatus Acididesulfobacter guangdongensis]|uniref:23S rRNA (Uracil(1939)-C(5))-methyltransferase RlmD n=1 Tax=Acididesulfobacter guangdongensis TaxID=2597225 RepID=A0A519BGB1_ACIG2|nr:MAG: 23S rRNA (uracil(1939)-C(5))-methyltransferase RlmD [Candidatus Acididesulfobacter guangdongensis]